MIPSKRKPGGQKMNDKRHTPDRRSWELTHFPLRDRHGYLVMCDRRYQPDRRLRNIMARVVR